MLMAGCGHFWLIECSRLPTVVTCFLSSRYCLGICKDPYWARSCTFCIQLSWPSSLIVIDSVCTSMPMTRRSPSAHPLMMLRLPFDVFLRVSSTSKHGWRLADFEWTPPRPMWCGWDLHSSWLKSMFRRFWWRRHVSTSWRRRITSVSSSTASWRCLRRCPLYVAVALTSYESSDHSSDRCHLTLKTRVHAFISCRLDYCN